MKKQHFLIPNIIICIIISLIVFIMPTEYKNAQSFKYIYIAYIAYNLIGCFINYKITSSKLNKDINNIPIINAYIVFNVVITIFLFIGRCFYISESITIILLLIFIGIYFIFAYSLYYAKVYINNRSEEIKNQTENTRNWKAKIEILKENNKEHEFMNEINKLYETIKYMDMTSNNQTVEIDRKITQIIDSINNSITIDEIQQLNKLFNERKIILKNSK